MTGNQFVVGLLALFCACSDAASQTLDQLLKANGASAIKKESKEDALLKKILSAKWWDNCRRYGKLRRAKSTSQEFGVLKDHLVRANYLNGIDLEAVADKSIRIGMTQCGVIGVMGLATRVNRHTSNYGSRDQMVFDNHNIRYIYTEERPGLTTQVVTSYSTSN